MNRKITAIVMAMLMINMDTSMYIHAMEISEKTNIHNNSSHQWKGKKVAFLGDSITDKARIGTQKCYWEYLAEMLEFEAYSYGINGNQMDGILKQAERLFQEHGQNIDAIIIFGGTNDFNTGVPIGKWFEEVKRSTTISERKKAERSYRVLSTDSNTFCGRINKLMNYLKTNFPSQQIILLTPLHRGYAQFGENNIQPEESYANNNGFFIDDYVQKIKEAGNIWAVPVIDLNSLSGLYPMNDSHVPYFHDGETDRLHPNAEGHKRIAKTLKYQMMALPASFK